MRRDRHWRHVAVRHHPRLARSQANAHHRRGCCAPALHCPTRLKSSSLTAARTVPPTSRRSRDGCPTTSSGKGSRSGRHAGRQDVSHDCGRRWSMCPEQALLMLPPVLHGYDVAIASRELPDSQRSGEPVWRHWIGRTYNRWSADRPHILDTQCGFKVFRAEAARAILATRRRLGLRRRGTRHRP